MNPQLATKSSFELLQLERLLDRAPQGLDATSQNDARRYFQKTEEYLEGENLLLGKLRQLWPLIEACFVGGGSSVVSPSQNGNLEKAPTQKALEALGEIQQNLKIAEGRQAVGL